MVWDADGGSVPTNEDGTINFTWNAEEGAEMYKVYAGTTDPPPFLEETTDLASYVYINKGPDALMYYGAVSSVKDGIETEKTTANIELPAVSDIFCKFELTVGYKDESDETSSWDYYGYDSVVGYGSVANVEFFQGNEGDSIIKFESYSYHDSTDNDYTFTFEVSDSINASGGDPYKLHFNDMNGTPVMYRLELSSANDKQLITTSRLEAEYLYSEFSEGLVLDVFITKG
jgi:hypothetical protein